MRFEQWRYKLPLLLRSLLRRGRVEQELDDELQYHFERHVEELMARGVSEHEARAQARRALGELDIRKEGCRDTWVVAVVDRLAGDLKHALRTLRHDAGFTAGVLSLLALGIGANVAVLSIVNGILVKPLPYPDSERLVVIRERIPETSVAPGPVNALHYAEWRGCDCFADVALAEFVLELNLAGYGDPERVRSLRVTPNAFSVLGVSAQIGRTFSPEDAEPGRNTVIVSDGLWRRRFNADPGILGETVSLDGVPSVVVGVLPAGFRHDWGGRNARVDIYQPWNAAPLPWWNWTNNYSYAVLARLANGVSSSAALERLNGIQAAIAAEHFTGEYASLSLRAVLIPLHEWVTGESREGLLLLLAAVGAALLVACLNIANLMLVRATARSREVGVRAALGASRLAIFRGVLIEGALLALAGAAIGVALAAGAVKIFTAVVPAGLPRIDEVRVDGFVLIAALGVAIVATIAFGLLPAVRMTRVDPQTALRSGGRSVSDSPTRQRLRQALVSAEVGLSAGLLIVAGLLLASFVRLGAVDRGYDSENVLTATVGLPLVRYPDDDSRLTFYASLLDELRSEPGVVAAGVTSALPLRGQNWGSWAIPEGTSLAVDERLGVDYRFVSPGYLEAMGIPLLAGRSLADVDRARNVAVLAVRTASSLWPGGDPIGRRFYRGSPDETFDVVGLVPDVPAMELGDDAGRPLVYVPQTAGFGVFPTVSVAVRTQGEPTLAAGTLRRAVASLDRELSISNVATMTQIESASLGERRFLLMLMVAFGAASLLIAALGTYSVLAYAVSIRAHDIAIRISLGAQRASVVAMMLRQGMRPVLVGLVLGIAGALLLGRFLSSFLFSVAPSDPAILAGVATITLAAALLAAWLPARSAARTSPLDVLRAQ